MNASFDSQTARTTALRNRVGMGSNIISKHAIKNVETKVTNDVEYIEDIQISKLVSNTFQPRLHIDADTTRELALTIKENGLLQPISVMPMDDGRYMIRYGHRRVEACKILGKDTIKAIVKVGEGDNKKLMSDALIENLQRDDMHIIDVALSMRSALDNGVFPNLDSLAAVVGKEKSQVSRILNILSLPEHIIIDIVKNKTISDRVVLDHLRKINDVTKCDEVYAWYKKAMPTRGEFITKLLGELTAKIEPANYEIKQTTRGCVIKTKPLTTEQITALEAFVSELTSRG